MIKHIFEACRGVVRKAAEQPLGFGEHAEDVANALIHESGVLAAKIAKISLDADLYDEIICFISEGRQQPKNEMLSN